MSKFNRRIMLRGMVMGSGVAVGLPLLDAFFDTNGLALADTGTAPPSTFGHWYQGLGLNPGMWVPKKAGAGYENNIQLKVLDTYRDKINIFSGMKYFLDGRPHETHTSTVQIATTGAVFDSGPIGPSLDSKIADVIGTRTRFRSLEVTLDGSRGSWSRRSGASVNASEGSPTALYARIFGAEFKDPNAADFTPDPLVIARKSVLSAISEQRADLAQQVGVADRARLDEFFTSIRDIETQLELELQKPAPMVGCKIPAEEAESKPDSSLENIVPNSKIIARLLSYAMACGQTRVVNLNLGAQGWRRQGAPNTWHTATHEEAIDPALGYQKIVYGYIEQANLIFADFIKTLAETREGDRTLLDRSLVLWQTDHGDARAHTVEDIPIITAGSGGGLIKTGMHIAAPGEPCTRVGLTVQQALGVPLNSWGGRSNQTSKTITEIL